MATKFKIHPAIGIARLGNSPDSFYLAPEGPGRLPIDCDASGVTTRVDGKEPTITSFRDAAGLVRRQGARFRIHQHDVDGSEHEVAIGAPIAFVYGRTGQRIEGTLADVRWTAYLANKKAIWYEFKELDGEHGYSASHPLRNADITDTTQRQGMIIDPGPQTVSAAHPRASFAKVDSAVAVQSFPPPLSPASITTLGDLLATQQPETDPSGTTTTHPRLVLLGGHGNSGSWKSGPGEPKMASFCNNDGWFDDEADGYVQATLIVDVLKVDGKVPLNEPPQLRVNVDVPSWVVVGYPRYAPQIVDIVTMDDTMYDVFVRTMAYAPDIYGVPPFDGSHGHPQTPEALAAWRVKAQWNTEYYPRFWRDIWPILRRPNQYQYVMTFTGGDPHRTTDRGNFNPERLIRDPKARQLIYRVLRKPGQENLYTVPGGAPDDPNYRLPGMPLLCGDNPLSNTAASKFLRLTDTMLFLLKQWADGKFIDEKAEHIPLPDEQAEPRSGAELDRGVLGNLLGGSFCPGAETTWIVRNPAIYAEPYRIKQSPNLTVGYLSQTEDMSVGFEPGDLTKRNAVPWQADFNECATQPIDLTYEDWNSISPGSVGDPVKPVAQTIYWWPAHRPMLVTNTSGAQVSWSGTIPVLPTGDLAMVTAWRGLGFVCDFKPDPAVGPQPVLVDGLGSGS